MLDRIANKPQGQVTRAEYDEAMRELRARHPDVQVDDDVDDTSGLSIDATITYPHDAPNTLTKYDLTPAALIKLVRDEEHPHYQTALVQQQLENGELGQDLQHVQLQLERDELKAVLPRDPAAKRLHKRASIGGRSGREQGRTVHRLPTTHTQKLLDGLVRPVEAAMAAKERARNGELDALSDNLNIAAGKEGALVEFEPTDEALDRIRAIDGASFRRGDKQNDAIKRPHWFVPYAKIAELEAAVPAIDRAIQRAQRTDTAGVSDPFTIAERIVGDHGHVRVRRDDDRLVVRFQFNKQANDQLRDIARFDSGRRVWAVQLKDAATLEERLPAMAEILAAAKRLEREAEDARRLRQAEQEEARQRFNQKKAVVLANIDKPSDADRQFMHNVAKAVKSDDLVKAKELHAYRDLLTTYRDYADVEGLPTDTRNKTAIKNYRMGQRAREAEEKVETLYASLTATAEADADDQPGLTR